MRNDLQRVQSVMALLESHGIATWLFGGWAEELHDMTAPRAHRDIDLLFPGESFTLVDRFLRSGEVQEVAAKRFPHKRAFMSDGVMTEMTIVGPDSTTLFWGRRRFDWPEDTFDHRLDGIRIASPAALAGYREAHPSLHGREMRTHVNGAQQS